MHLFLIIIMAILLLLILCNVEGKVSSSFKEDHDS
jgi:hypothetical protein